MRTIIYLTDKQLAALKKLSGVSMAEHIRRALDQYLEQQPQRRSARR